MDPAASYDFSANSSRLDPEWIHQLLRSTYWAQGRSREDQDHLLRTSRNYGVYVSSTGAQVGYARIVTDEVTFAWLADVVIDPAHRRMGLGRLLIDGLLGDLAPMGLRRVVLKASQDGRALYEQKGWQLLDAPDDWLELRR